MSNKTQLQTNNTALASLTDRVLAAKDTAAALPDASGGAVETCTVEITSFAKNISNIKYSTFSNGEYRFEDRLFTPNVDSISLHDVLVGSYFYILSTYGFCGWIYDSTKLAYYNSGYRNFEFVPIADTTINIIDDD